MIWTPNNFTNFYFGFDMIWTSNNLPNFYFGLDMIWTLWYVTQNCFKWCLIQIRYLFVYTLRLVTPTVPQIHNKLITQPSGSEWGSSTTSAHFLLKEAIFENFRMICTIKLMFFPIVNKAIYSFTTYLWKYWLRCSKNTDNLKLKKETRLDTLCQRLLEF